MSKDRPGIPISPNDDVRRLNPHLYGGSSQPAAPVPAMRLRQKQGPKLNKLEMAFLDYLTITKPIGATIHSQAITFTLANGVRYTPDFVVFAPDPSITIAYEVKGPHSWDDAIVKLKFAASVYPWINWLLVWRENPRAQWHHQGILE